MENKFTPEHLVLNSIDTMRKSTEAAGYIAAPLAHAFLKVFTWGLDGLISHFEGLKRLEPYTKAMRNTMWKDEYKRVGLLA